ncbi:hypothetical protein CKK33_16355 [Mucilaginibacter sp. MD40]|nr:hypothetical protein CKK33_16355 [Mucilaginibacter sp. MD40]
MPFGILNTSPLHMPTITNKPYGVRIARYFNFIKGEFHTEQLPDKKDKTSFTEQKVWDREPEPPTLAGLALYLGFNSLDEFEAYERNGKHKKQLRMGRLMIEAEYEKRLHYQSATGAIFALKNLGWKESNEPNALKEVPKTIHIKITTSGPKVANSEKEVEL